MSLLAAPLLSTPLLKVPILLTNATLTWMSMTPPNPPPPSEEQDNFTKPDLFTRTYKLQMKLVVLSRSAICAIALAEAATIFAQEIPCSISDRVLSFLVPGGPLRALPLQILPRYLFGAVIALIGGAVRVWSYRTLGRFFTWQLAVKSDHKLVTEGPYAFVRHPSYTSWVMVLIGNFIMFTSAGSYFTEAGLWGSTLGKLYLLAAFGYSGSVGVQIVSRVNKEDAVLREKFGAEWEAWAKQARYQLIPFVY
ncbi:ICMT-domain-containing protein [Trametes meyenii]|nr:ICMT-domain-containing protein [Trametes meyenii]